MAVVVGGAAGRREGGGSTAAATRLLCVVVLAMLNVWGVAVPCAVVAVAWCTGLLQEVTPSVLMVDMDRRLEMVDC